MKYNINQNVILKEENNNKTCSFCDCRFTTVFILMFMVWDLLIVGIALRKIPPLIFAGVYYIIYLIIELLSMKKFFTENKNPQEIKEILGNLFISQPKITFECHIYERNNKYIYSEIEPFKILSYRDASGIFNLNYDGESYNYLELEMEIKFADNISCMDFVNQKEQFNENEKDKYNYKNKIVIFNEKEEISEFLTSQIYRIKINKNQGCSSVPMFYLFAILALGGIYEIIYNCSKKNKKFKIVKVISTRYNLRDEPKLDPFIPGLVFQGDLYKYNKEDISNFDQNNNISPPTPEELIESKNYEYKIFDYNSSDGNNILNPQIIGTNNNIYNNINKNFNYYGNNNAYNIPVDVNINQGINKNNETSSNLNFNNYQTKEKEGNLFGRNMPY